MGVWKFYTILYKSERYKLRDENGFFGRSGIFEEEEEDRESFVQSVRRPASTGVIGRRNESEDVNSILETLGLASLESSEQDVSSSYVGNAMGGIGSYKSPVKQSMMAKIREGGDTPTSNSNESNNFFIGEERQSGSNPFANQGQVGLQNNSVQSNGSSSSLQQQGVQYQYPAASDVSQLMCAGTINIYPLFLIRHSPFFQYRFLFLVINHRITLAAITMVGHHCFPIK